MSEESRMITVRAPHGHITLERLVLHGLRCGYCQGNGWFWGHDEIGESVKEPLPDLQGPEDGRGRGEDRMESGGWRGGVTPRTELEGIETTEARAAAQQRRTEPSTI